jgi:ATP-dependent RNA helicase SUPV3L1/SUV3
VIAASRALEEANASADAQRIRTAMAALEQALRGARSATPGASPAAMGTGTPPVAAAEPSDGEAGPAAAESAASSEPAAVAEPVKPAKPAKPVVAMRGDDRPGGRLPTAVPSAQRPGARPGRSDGPPGRMGGSAFRSDPRAARDERGGRDLPPQGPRLGDAAFRAQRDALERAQLALRKLAAQAHGESLTQLLGAWRQRDPAALPSASDLGSRVPAAARAAWAQALGRAAAGDAATAMLRLEIASETPSPAEHHSARRLYQLQMLTRRHDAPPAQTWVQDVATVLASAIDDEAERRLRQSLKQLLKP